MNLGIEPIEEIMEIEPKKDWRKYAAVIIVSVIFVGAGYGYLSKNSENSAVNQVFNSIGFISNVAGEAFSNIFKNGESKERLVESIDLNMNRGQIAAKSKNSASVSPKQNSYTANIIDSGFNLNKTNKVSGNKQDNNTSQPSKIINLSEFSESSKNLPTKQSVDSQKEKAKTIEPVKPAILIKDCSFNTSQSLTYQKVIINEVAWMGGSETFGLTANDEWVELKNISGSEIDLNGWQILDKGEQIKIRLTYTDKTQTNTDNKFIVKPNQFILLERTDDSSVPNVTADILYTGALSNSNEGLRLFDNQCNLMDEVFADSKWPAGDAAARRTMERGLSLSWHTYNGVAVNNIFGTPKKENSTPAVVYSGVNNAAPVNNQQPTTNDQQQSSAPKILISEVQTKGGTGESDNEFIEVYNPSDSVVDLSALPLKLHIRNSNGKDSNKPLTFINNTILAKGYFLIGPASGYIGLASLDATYSGSSGNKLVDNGGVYISKSATADVDALDKLGWGKQPLGGFETSPVLDNPGANESISRKSEIDTDNNANDFIKSKSTPKNSGTAGGFISPES